MCILGVRRPRWHTLPCSWTDYAFYSSNYVLIRINRFVSCFLVHWVISFITRSCLVLLISISKLDVTFPASFFTASGCVLGAQPPIHYYNTASLLSSKKGRRQTTCDAHMFYNSQTVYLKASSSCILLQAGRTTESVLYLHTVRACACVDRVKQV